ncbi:MAG TPA: YggT family protein [Gemmatimonadaceae bacterium]|nr:YggT family protein [Gemmatimonadaceae bacterium]
MTTFLVGFDLLLLGVRWALLVLAATLFVVFGIDWLVRTRRINPFGAPARFVRKAVDPFLAPVERRVVRAGSLPASAPWWALVVVVVGGILLIVSLQFVRRMIVTAAISLNGGPRGLYDVLVSWTFGLLELALIVRIIASWLGINPYRPWIRWSVSLTEWLLKPLRSVIPPFGMLDVSPLVAYVILVVLESFMHSIGAA